MDNTLDESDFVKDQNLHARESNQSSGNISKDITNSTPVDDALIKKTRSVWESAYGREITDTEAMEIIERFANIFDVMSECGAKANPSPENCNGEDVYA